MPTARQLPALFDALATTAVDWDGAICSPNGSSSCDLSANVVTDLGVFDSRDDLFRLNGQTMCLPARILADPVLGRWSAVAGRVPA